MLIPVTDRGRLFAYFKTLAQDLEHNDILSFITTDERNSVTISEMSVLSLIYGTTNPFLLQDQMTMILEI